MRRKKILDVDEENQLVVDEKPQWLLSVWTLGASSCNQLVHADWVSHLNGISHSGAANKVTTRLKGRGNVPAGPGVVSRWGK